MLVACFYTKIRPNIQVFRTVFMSIFKDERFLKAASQVIVRIYGSTFLPSIGKASANCITKYRHHRTLS